MDIKELKSQAYDLISLLEAHNAKMAEIRQKLSETNGEISKLMEQQAKEKSDAQGSSLHAQ